MSKILKFDDINRALYDFEFVHLTSPYKVYLSYMFIIVNHNIKWQMYSILWRWNFSDTDQSFKYSGLFFLATICIKWDLLS